MKLSACIEMVYDDQPFHKRIYRAADDGADAVEFWDWRDKDLEAISSAADDTEIPIIGCTAGGILTDPEAADETVSTVRESIETAADLGCSVLILTTGPDQQHIESDIQQHTIVDILQRVAPDAEHNGVTLVLEPLNNAVDHPDSYLSSVGEALSIIDQVDSHSVKILYDVYHQQITEGNLISTIIENVEHIGHIHIADVPGRHEPGTGEINYENVLDAVDKAGYTNYIGCEFKPVSDPNQAMSSIPFPRDA